VMGFRKARNASCVRHAPIMGLTIGYVVSNSKFNHPAAENAQLNRIQNLTDCGSARPARQGWATPKGASNRIGAGFPY
jgi:hypothetical protein